MTRFRLDKLLRPTSVAVVGASPRAETVGFRVIQNLRRLNYTGPIFPVNPRYQEVAGLRCYPSVAALPTGVDAAFVAIPAAQGPGVLEELAALGVGAVEINASGFADGGPEGQALQARLRALAIGQDIALCGPNNMGFVNVLDRTALWSGARLPELRPGPVAVISQSGSIAIALGQDERRMGLAYVITTGNEAGLTVADYLDFIARDDRVRVFLLFIETLRDPARFAEAAAMATARGQRIIAVKVGRSEGGRQLAAAHTGAISGEDDVYDAFFRRHRIVRVADLDEMLETALLSLAYPDGPPTPHVLPLTLSGGEAALIADLAADSALSLPPLALETLERLRPTMPSFSSPRNPLDAWGLGWDVDRFTRMLDALLPDPAFGTIACAVDAPSAGGADESIVTQMARVCAEIAPTTAKRFVFFNNASGGGPNAAIRAVLAQAGIPYLSGMRPALAAIAHWIRRAEPSETPDTSPAADEPLAERWRTAARKARALTERDRFRLMREAGITMVPCEAVASADEAVKAAARVGYPVALKGTAPDLLHKTELGLVRLDLDGPEAVRAAFAELAGRLARRDGAGLVVQRMAGPGIELIAAIRNDLSFGTVVVAGLGGIHVEVFREAATRLGPVERETALAMLRETRAGALLAGVRGKGPFDAEAAAEAIAALSRFGAATRGLLSAVEINPLIALEQGQGAVGVDVLWVEMAPPVTQEAPVVEPAGGG